MTDIIKTDEAKNIQQNVPQKFMNNFDMQGLLVNAGNVELTEEQKKILYAPIDEALISIKPTGIVYLSWSFYATRLKDAFGMQWAIIPNGMPQMQNNLVIWGFYLYIKGSLMGFAIGEQNYIASNKEMSYTDACEGAKSNALMRLCKEIGIGLELWQQEYVNTWKKKHAISYQEYDENKKKSVTRWKKKTDIKTPKNNDDVKKELENSLKNDKPEKKELDKIDILVEQDKKEREKILNENLIKKTFGSKILTPKKDEIYNLGKKIAETIDKKEFQSGFKNQMNHYIELKKSQIELTDEDYQLELEYLKQFELDITNYRKNKTGAINDNDPEDPTFHIEDKKEAILPKGVL